MSPEGGGFSGPCHGHAPLALVIGQQLRQHLRQAPARHITRCTAYRFLGGHGHRRHLADRIPPFAGHRHP